MFAHLTEDLQEKLQYANDALQKQMGSVLLSVRVFRRFAVTR